MKIKPRKICYYTAPDWKWRVYLKALEKAETREFERGALIKELTSDPLLKARARDVASFVVSIAEQISRMPSTSRKLRIQLGKIDELNALRGAIRFYSKQFQTEVNVFAEDDPERYDPKGRSKLAQPYRPAIFIEA